jgi:hypothetical protein
MQPSAWIQPGRKTSIPSLLANAISERDAPPWIRQRPPRRLGIPHPCGHHAVLDGHEQRVRQGAYQHGLLLFLQRPLAVLPVASGIAPLPESRALATDGGRGLRHPPGLGRTPRRPAALRHGGAGERRGARPGSGALRLAPSTIPGVLAMPSSTGRSGRADFRSASSQRCSRSSATHRRRAQRGRDRRSRRRGEAPPWPARPA